VLRKYYHLSVILSFWLCENANVIPAAVCNNIQTHYEAEEQASECRRRVVASQHIALYASIVWTETERDIVDVSQPGD